MPGGKPEHTRLQLSVDVANRIRTGLDRGAIPGLAEHNHSRSSRCEPCPEQTGKLWMQPIASGSCHRV
ncbi:hypothetical protein MPLDJ20_70055 [Mesorhizobium plurifarium]|uniref:Uncharacterized protein n=1 Tax=Mesorhizobium plurifarium TaxID=69974 RepID=A0A090FTX5_MESPL|nr:hypothetical protein MPLDJ20_70055 [Mesorhizobium plurifarium]